MTNTQTAEASSSIVTTTQIRRADKVQLSISYDYTGLVNSTPPAPQKLQSLIDLAIRQWWDGLTNLQRSGPSARPLSLRISAHYRE